MNLTLQDLLAILGPMGTLVGFMWYHFNNSFEKIERRIDSVEQKLGEKIDAVRDRVSRIEGQLVPAKIISFEEIRPRESTEQKSIRK
jgi:hypothetical protein